MINWLSSSSWRSCWSPWFSSGVHPCQRFQLDILRTHRQTLSVDLETFPRLGGNFIKTCQPYSWWLIDLKCQHGLSIDKPLYLDVALLDVVVKWELYVLCFIQLSISAVDRKSIIKLPKMNQIIRVNRNRNSANFFLVCL